MPVALSDQDRCPCGSGDVYGSCCGPLHRGERSAPTAEALMRSRYSAFAVGAGEYLRETWHPSTRPDRMSLDDDLVWNRLDVVSTLRGGPFDTEGIVHFVAHHRGAGGRGRQEEISRFRRERGRWYYVDGQSPAS